MAEDKKKATSTPSQKTTVKKSTTQSTKKTIKREDVAKIAESAKKAATTVKKAAKTSVHQTAVAIIKVQDATKKKVEQKKAERAAAAKEPTAKKKKTWQDIRVMGGNLLSKMAKGGALELRSNAEEVSFMNTTEDKLREDFRNNARIAVQLQAAVELIADLENLTATKEEIEEAKAVVARQNRMTLEQLEPYCDAEFEQALIRSILTGKVMSLIRDSADIAVV